MRPARAAITLGTAALCARFVSRAVFRHRTCPCGGRRTQGTCLGLDDRRDDHRPPVEYLAEMPLQVALDQRLHDAAIGALLGGRGLDGPAHDAPGLPQHVLVPRTGGESAACDLRLALHLAGPSVD